MPSSSSSNVRVGVRIRPLTSLESSQNGHPILTASLHSSSLTLSKRTFTYDAVFDDNVSQSDLYNNVRGELLDAFLNGYNATVLAYGQTGSGKTFTMGSENHGGSENYVHNCGGAEKDGSYSLSESDGLIPRFMADIFNILMGRRESSKNATLTEQQQQSDALIDFKLSATFLEVYGEDIHDLLDEDRKSLPIREDSNGEVIVVGLRSTQVSSDVEALNVLNTGTMNRTTAATLMNCTSSRSHAVFTVNLVQVVRGAEGVDVTTTSRFTFVE
jgi:hypothetical protein